MRDFMTGNTATPEAPPFQWAHVASARVDDDEPVLTVPALARLALEHTDGQSVALRFQSLCRMLGSRLPWPAAGATIIRWRTLSVIAGSDLSLGRLFEGHTDAVAILNELGASALHAPEATWGVWAAEARQRVQIASRSGTHARLSGTKHWCSGAPFLTHALVTAWHGSDGPYLAAVALQQPGVGVHSGRWAAIGMADSASHDVAFDEARATLIGTAGEYLSRPGFWQGAIGVAACWLGGAVALGEIARQYMPAAGDPIRAAHLGAIDAALSQARDVMRAAATWVDAHPAADARLPALRARWAVEQAAQAVLHHAGRLLGASAYCLNPTFARMAADLPVYLRQSHAEHDLAVIGNEAKTHEPGTWSL